MDAAKSGYVIGRDESGLTQLEREIGQMLVDGWKRNAVARELKISRQRVAEVVKNLNRKAPGWESWPSSRTAEQRRHEAAAADRAAGIVPDEL